jgi:hypothetical protein
MGKPFGLEQDCCGVSGMVRLTCLIGEGPENVVLCS